VRFQSPSIQSPTPFAIVVSAVDAGTGLPKQFMSFTVEHFTPCAFEARCSKILRIVDSKLLSDSPPISDACYTEGVCVDQNTLPQPSVTAMSPTEDSASGGTLISLSYRNLPAFDVQDLIVSVGAGSLVVLAPVQSITPTPGSTLSANSGTVVFSVPKVPGGLTSVVTTSVMTLSVLWGAIQRNLTTSFTYTPLVEGSAVIDTIYPQQIGSEIIGQIVRVKVINFPKVLLTENAKVLAEFGGATDIVALSVLQSSYVRFLFLSLSLLASSYVRSTSLSLALSLSLVVHVTLST
jgi:hypothetical protein